MVGAATIVKVKLFEVTPPEDTLTCAVPALATRLAGTVALSSFALWKVVDSAEPFQSTVAPEANPVPLATKVKAALPSVIVSGFIPPSVGPGTMVNVSELELTLLVLTVI
jgi:hypothetical protein